MHFSAVHPALAGLCWTPYFHQQFLALLDEVADFAGWLPERVTAEWRGEYQLLGAQGARRAVLSGRLQRELVDEQRPCVGDFVLAMPTANGDLTRIEHRFERASTFSRKAAGTTTRPQPIAANIDLAIVVSALAEPDAAAEASRHGINVRRVERYLRAIAEAPAQALVVLSKADLRPDAQAEAEELGRQLGQPVLLVSARSGLGMEPLLARLQPGVTAVLVGPSGVGKSSLTNCLLGGEVQRVEAVREFDARGRHTTTHREIFQLPSGGLLIDTPGMRELGLHADEVVEDGHTGFEDIDALALDCRFRDCGHDGEPGCAVQAAAELGRIEPARVEHARKLRREIAWQQARNDARKRAGERKQNRVVTVAARAGQRLKGRD
jgi:ribosome biogenesis GTPase